MPEIKIAEIKKILIIRLRFIGDVIISTPVIKALKKAHPGIEISYLAEEAPLEMLKHNPNISELLVNRKSRNTDLLRTVSEIRSRKYDAVIDLFGNPRSALLTLLSGARYRIGWKIRGRGSFYNRHIIRKDVLNPKDKSDCIEAYEDMLGLFGVRGTDKKTEIFISGEERKFAKDYASKIGLDINRQLVGLQPGSRRGITMTWPKEKYAELAGRLIEEGKQVILFGGSNDKTVNKEVNELTGNKAFVAEGLSIRQDVALMELCDCFVTNNHGPVHMAIAVETPTIGIFRPDETFLWFPYKDKRYRVIDKAGTCEVCTRSACLDPKCMNNIEAAKVMEQVKELLLLNRKRK